MHVLELTYKSKLRAQFYLEALSCDLRLPVGNSTHCGL